jgi:hypothetical protein
MADAHASVVDLNRLDRGALEALVVAQQEKLLTRNSEIEHLKLISGAGMKKYWHSASEARCPLCKRCDKCDDVYRLDKGEQCRCWPWAMCGADNIIFCECLDWDELWRDGRVGIENFRPRFRELLNERRSRV